MQTIKYNSYPEQDRAQLQERIIWRVQNIPELLLMQYERDPRSFGGRYIGADLFKELFPEYSASKETRARYNAVVHNAAAVLSAEQLHRVIADHSHMADVVVFLTGVPGAGKSSSISTMGQLSPKYKAVFEGQLSRPEPSISKIQAVLDAGMQPLIIAVHNTPEQALANTFRRFEETGRGASIGLMADIQGNLPAGLATLQRTFGERVTLAVYDYTDKKNPATYYGWKHVSILQREGNHEQIRQRLASALERYREAGTISDGCWEQANGRLPRDFSLLAGMGCQGDGGDQTDERGRGVPEGGSPQAAVGDVLSRALETEREARELLAQEQYSAILDIYYRAKQAQIERLETKLDKAVVSLQARLKTGQAQKPGFFSSRRTKAAWQARQDQTAKRLFHLSARKRNINIIKTAMGGERLRLLVTKKLCFREPVLAFHHDAAMRRAVHRDRTNITQVAVGTNIVQCAGDLQRKPKSGLRRQRKP